MKKITVLVSNEGTGSNLLAIVNAIRNKKIDAKIVSVIAYSKNAKSLQIAKQFIIPEKICQNKEDLLPLLQTLSPDYIVLAGWKQIITDAVLDAFPNRILNLHPGLIPDNISVNVQNPDGTEALWNKGLYAQKAIANFLTRKATYAGSSIHFLGSELDFGPVLGRTYEKVKQSDTIDSLYTRLKKKENMLYVEVLVQLCKQ